MKKLTPFLWFDDDLEQAMAFYTSPATTRPRWTTSGDGSPKGVKRGNAAGSRTVSASRGRSSRGG
jgi:predicted 3-demethylubiquinone-9 3-methyltransferase (glyoxalase superfamily)